MSAFSAYATGGTHAFATPAPKRSGSGSPALGESTAEGERSANPLAAGGEGESPEESENEIEKTVSFGERLRASKDKEEGNEEKRLSFTEQESRSIDVFLALSLVTYIYLAHTGEEDEQTVYQVRGKLYALNAQHQWKERGTGQLKLNVRRDDGTGARLRAFLSPQVVVSVTRLK